MRKDTSIIGATAPNLSGVLRFPPAGHKTKDGWRYEEDRIPNPDARFRLVKGEDGPYRVYARDQTHPNSRLGRSPRTEWERRFYWHADKNKYLTVNAQGKTHTLDRRLRPERRYPRLDQRMLDLHLQGRIVRGVFAKPGKNPLTWWVAIDLDLHVATGGNPDLFLRTLRVLLDFFWLRYKCHVVVSEGRVNGVHLYVYFGKPVPLAEAVERLRVDLKRLHEANPDLAAAVAGWNEAVRALPEAKANWGVKPLFDPAPEKMVEIYPSQTHGFKVMGVRGKVCLADAVIGTVPHQDGVRFDLGGWWRSLNTNQRMAVEEVVLFVAARMPTGTPGVGGGAVAGSDGESVVEAASRFASPPRPRGEEGENGSITSRSLSAESGPDDEPDDLLADLKAAKKVRWRGNTFRILTDYWRGSNPHGLTFGVASLVTQRCWAKNPGMTAERSAALVKEWARKLPPSFSSRLDSDAGLKSLDRDVDRQAGYVFGGNARQKRVGASDVKLAAVATTWLSQGLRLDDPATWSLFSRPETVQHHPAWDVADLRAFDYLMGVLKIRDRRACVEFVSGVVNLVVTKEREENGWHNKYLGLWAKKRFPGIRLAKRQKQQAVIVALQELNVIRLTVAGLQALRTSTRWTLGDRAVAALVRAGERPASPPRPRGEGGGEWVYYFQFPFRA